MRIFLVGFMGCGKSTLGKKLATFLNYDFVDLDKALEVEAGMTVGEYFKQHGEASFREFERDLLQKTKFPENIVIATGGGAPCFFDNMDWMNANGLTIYISMSPKALANRLSNAKTERPLIRNLNPEELVDFITARLESREPFYKKAKYSINGGDLTAGDVVELIPEFRRIF